MNTYSIYVKLIFCKRVHLQKTCVTQSNKRGKPFLRKIYVYALTIPYRRFFAKSDHLDGDVISYLELCVRGEAHFQHGVN